MEKPTLDKIEALAGRGLTEPQIADALGIDIEKLRGDKTRSRPTARRNSPGKAKGLLIYRMRFSTRPRRATREP